MPVTVVSKCYKFLRAPSPQVPSAVEMDGATLTFAEAHRAWCHRLLTQCSGPSCHAELLQDAAHRRDSLLGRLWAQSSSLGEPECSQPLLQSIVSDWDASFAVPADMIPRAAYKCSDMAWSRLVFALHSLAGPAGWSLRPTIWRWVTLGLTYKKSPLHDVSSWRLLFIRSQMGLLQECFLGAWMRPAIRQ